MESANDLLSEYVRNGSEAAFAEVVKRYMDFVYSIAARRLGAQHEAIQDVVQTVFVDLARKAGTLRKESTVGGWLHRHTCFIISKFLRSEQHRLHKERAATDEKALVENGSWPDLAVVLDEAIQILNPADRAAVLMRFFEGTDFKTIGANFGTNEDAAQKRVSRALEKLKDVLLKKGVRVSALTLASLLAAHSILAAPQVLALTIAENVGRYSRHAAPIREPGIRTPVKLLFGGLAALSLLLLGFFMARSPDKNPSSGVQNTALIPPGSEPRQLTPLNTPRATASFDIGKELVLKVVETGSAQSLSNVSLELSLFSDRFGRSKSKSMTDDEGTAVLTFPAANSGFYFEIRLSRDGYVDRYVSWSSWQKDSWEDIPKEYTASLSKGTPIGGFVQDPRGDAISGVEVMFSGPSEAGIPPRERDTVMGYYHKEYTDSTGRWSCTHAPKDYIRTTFELRHPEFVTTTYVMTGADDSSPELRTIPSADFLSGRAEMTMAAGIVLRGKVVDENGLPVIQAKVIEDLRFSDKQSKCVTDAAGTFRFSNCATGSVRLTIVAQGFAPFSTALFPKGDAELIELILAASKGLRGTVADEDGKEIGGATVQPARDDLQWEAKTDSNGSFFWDSSPNEKIRMTFSAPGFQRKTEEVQPGPFPIHITLRAANEDSREFRRIQARVLSAETQMPIAGAEVMLREYVTRGGYSPSSAGKTDSEGRLDLKLASDTQFFEFEVKAESFFPEVSSNLVASNAPPEVTIQLHPGTGVEGFVLLPTGEPAPKAEVGLLTKKSSLFLGKRQLLFRDQGITTETDESGRFVFLPQHDLVSIVAVHSSGFARIEVEEWKNGGKIKLQPYATIQGTFLLNGASAGNSTIGLLELGGASESGLKLDSQMPPERTSAAASFTFLDIPPGWVKIAWFLPFQSGFQTSHPKAFKIEPGVENNILFEVAGRPIRGKLANPGRTDVDWTSYQGSFRLKTSEGELSSGDAAKFFPILLIPDGTFSSPAILRANTI